MQDLIAGGSRSHHSGPGINGRNGFRIVSWRAKSVEAEADLAPLSEARMLPRDLLHPVIAAKAWMPFMRGDYDAAVFEAMEQLEADGAGGQAHRRLPG